MQPTTLGLRQFTAGVAVFVADPCPQLAALSVGESVGLFDYEFGQARRLPELIRQEISDDWRPGSIVANHHNRADVETAIFLRMAFCPLSTSLFGKQSVNWHYFLLQGRALTHSTNSFDGLQTCRCDASRLHKAGLGKPFADCRGNR